MKASEWLTKRAAVLLRKERQKKAVRKARELLKAKRLEAEKEKAEEQDRVIDAQIVDPSPECHE